MEAIKACVLALIVLASAPAFGKSVWDEPAPNIYWGDLHVHTNFSWDAYGFRMAPGIYTEEAGLYGAYCSKLDYWAYTDHAEALTDRRSWDITIDSVKRFNDLGAANLDSNGDPSIVALMGFEWSQSVPYGHKNIIFKYGDRKRLTPGPIPSSRQVVSKHLAYSTVSRALAPGKKEAINPAKLFERLDRECLKNGSGCKAVAIPHGNAWGLANFHTYWDIQDNPAMNRPDVERGIEVYSKHGNSEEYRYFPPEYRYFKGGVEIAEQDCKKGKCDKVCGEPTDDYEPCCWRAGEIVKERCEDPESDFCREQVEIARQGMAVFPGHIHPWQRKYIKKKYRRHPGVVDAGEWQSCGQCRTCYQPAWNYIPDGSVQKALATYGEDERGKPMHFRFGFVGSTDTHQGRPGSVKEIKYFDETEHFTGPLADLDLPKYILEAFDIEYLPALERGPNFYNPGGLAAILSPRRTNIDLFDNLYKRRVYGTTGARIEVWLRAEVHDGDDKIVEMGEETTSSENPVFHIRANGAFREDETCRYDDEPAIKSNLTSAQFLNICYNQCYKVTDERAPIDRIEVVKILQPMNKKEGSMKNPRRGQDNPDGLIIDPYYMADFKGEPSQIEWTWSDNEFVNEPAGRSVAYYFRVIQGPTEGYNCNPTAVLEKKNSCDARNPSGRFAVDPKVNPQNGSTPTPRNQIEDPCYTDVNDPETYCQERAWTSPVYITRK